MDELYGDLENYNEVFTVDQLRNENKDLKLKLEEYETAMGKLQKDYDKLAKEFNNLQMNYSSLLKTARAEVERKAKMITQLNIDKDMMVLQTLQNGGNKNLLNNRNRFQKGAPAQKKSLEPSQVKVSKKDKLKQAQQSSVVKNERLHTSASTHLSSAPTKEDSKLLSIVDKVVDEVDTCISKSEMKENVSQSNTGHKLTPNTHTPNSIKDRRKSMLAVGEPKFSSDEESEPDNPTKQILKNVIPPNDNCETRSTSTVTTRVSDERLSNKTSETSSIDGRHSNYHEHIRHSYKSRSSRYSETDKYREGDRYRDHEKYRDSDKNRDGDKYKEDKYRDNDRYRGSDKYRMRDKYDPSYRNKRPYSPDRSHRRFNREYQDDYGRPEHGRPRLLESPPLEVHGHYRNRNQEHRPQPEKHTHDSDKYKPHYEERHGKYSISNQPYEPSSKRQKLDSKIDREQIERYDKESASRLSQTEAKEYEMFRQSSCQSPDIPHVPDTHVDTTTAHTVKEIKNTAATQLEDPRVTSNKYILKAENGKTILSTAVSKHINIKPVDKSLWHIESVVVPDALLHEPRSELTDDNIKEIYMDIDNPPSSNSVESGEITSEDADSVANSKSLEPRKPSLNLELIENATEEPSLKMVNTSPPHKVTSKYRIPKLKQGNENAQKKLNVCNNMSKHVDQSVSQHVLKDNEISVKSSLPHIAEHLKQSTCEVKEHKQRTISLSEMAMVQDDLELSDETSDNIELHRQVVADKEVTRKSLQNVEKEIKVLEKEPLPSFNILSKGNTNNSAVTDHKTKDTSKETDVKKQKTKRRKTKSKEIELTENTEPPVIVPATEKKIKSKKDRESKPKQIKSKFTDLFGDSSSLITPEDLGIPATSVPLCEDAQDAVDVNLKEIAINQDKIINSNVENRANSNYNKNEICEESTYDTNIENPSTEDKEIAKRIEEQIASPADNDNIIYQNLNAESESAKPDVVKTVIISTGIQPQFLMNDVEGAIEKRVADVEVNIQNIVNSNQLSSLTEFKKQPLLQALATSTPHKEISVLKTIENNSKIIDANDSKADSVNVTGNDQTNTDAQDAPDVRIFVRRRRKGIKKP